MSSREVAEWMAFDRIEPFGDQRADIRSAIVACTTANVNRGKGPPLEVKDFMPKFEKPRAMTMEEMKAKFGV